MALGCGSRACTRGLGPWSLFPPLGAVCFNRPVKPPGARAVATKKTAKKEPPKTTKQGRPPPKVIREQAALRREAKRDGLPNDQAELTDFAARFCVEYVRCGILEDAHRATELALRVPLDTTGYEVEIEESSRTVKGKAVYSKVYHITDSLGREISESELRQASAFNLYALPEVQRRIRELRAEAASLVKVTAESLATKLALIQDHAVRLGQLQVATNCVAMEAKMFGIEAGPGEGAGAALPAASVDINIRDYTGKPKRSQGD